MHVLRVRKALRVLNDENGRNLLEPYVGLPFLVAIGVNLARVQNDSRGLRVSLPACAGRERPSWRWVDCGFNAVVAWSAEEACAIENHSETTALAAETRVACNHHPFLIVYPPLVVPCDRMWHAKHSFDEQSVMIFKECLAFAAGRHEAALDPRVEEREGVAVVDNYLQRVRSRVTAGSANGPAKGVRAYGQALQCEVKSTLMLRVTVYNRTCSFRKNSHLETVT